MASYIGIDLGTTYSCIAQCDEHNMVAVIPCPEAGLGNAIPSVVYFDENGKPSVGDEPKASMATEGYAERTLSFIKRSMGADFCPTPIATGPLGSTTTRLVSPVEGSACILYTLFQAARRNASSHGQEVPTKAVITIPAGYTNKQRSCTKKAAEMAGIKVLGLIHEPTAAAICHDIKSGEAVLVFDLGGGTLDVSIVRNDQGKYKVLGVASDTDVLGHNLGGKDWDERLKDIACMLRSYTPSRRSEEGTLMLSAENCKKALSSRTDALFSFPDIQSIRIKRNDFVINTRDLVGDCLKVIDACIENADRETPGGKVDINRFIMVGGSSNMPMLKKAISQQYGDRFSKGREELLWLIVSPDAEASIAKGAAKYASILERNPNSDKELTIEDRSSHSYGTSVRDRHSSGEQLLNLIKATDPMVFESKEFQFCTSEDGQRGVKVDIYENNSLDDVIPLPETMKYIYNQSYEFGKQVPARTEVVFRVSRDKDGLIKIHVSSAGCPSKDFEASTMQPPITAEVEKQVKKSIKLMGKD